MFTFDEFWGDLGTSIFGNWNSAANNTRSRPPPEVFYKKFLLRYFAIFTGKHLCWSLFLQNFIKKRLQHRCFPVNIEEFLRTHFSQNTSRRLLLYFCNNFSFERINHKTLDAFWAFDVHSVPTKGFLIFSGGIDNQERATLTLRERLTPRPSRFPSLIMTNRGFSVCYIWPSMATSKKPAPW